MTRRVLWMIVDTALISVTLVLYGAAYGVIGYYIAVAIEAAGADFVWVSVWMLAWVAAGSSALTVWVMRTNGIGLGRPRRDRSRSAPTPSGTFPPDGATPWP